MLVGDEQQGVDVGQRSEGDGELLELAVPISEPESAIQVILVIASVTSTPPTSAGGSNCCRSVSVVHPGIGT